MSFYLATCYPDRVELLTDGAAYTADGVLRAKMRKVRIVAPGVVMTSRGVVEQGERIGDIIERIFEVTGDYDGAQAMLQDQLARGRPDVAADVLIAGLSPKYGPVTHRFSTVDVGDGEPFRVRMSKGSVICGLAVPDHGHACLAGAGTLALIGARKAEMARTMTGEDPGGAMHGFVGGWLDLTSVSTAGVKTVTIHEWHEDVVGERFGANRPTYATPRITLPPMAGMNRKQRKAMAAQQRIAA